MNKKIFALSIAFLFSLLSLGQIQAAEKDGAGDEKKVEEKAPGTEEKKTEEKKTEEKKLPPVSNTPKEGEKKLQAFFEISLPAFYTDLEDTTAKDTTDGAAAGIRFAFEGLFNSIWGRAELTTGFGGVEEDKAGGQSYDFTMVNFSIDVGFAIRMDKLLLVPYLGFGTGFFNYDRSGVESDVFHFYFALGGHAEMSISDKLTVGVDLSVRILAAGDFEIKFTGGKTSEDLDANVGIRFMIPVRFFVTPNLAISFNLFYDFMPWEAKNLNNYELHQVGAYIGAILKV